MIAADRRWDRVRRQVRARSPILPTFPSRSRASSISLSTSSPLRPGSDLSPRRRKVPTWPRQTLHQSGLGHSRRQSESLSWHGQRPRSSRRAAHGDDHVDRQSDQVGRQFLSLLATALLRELAFNGDGPPFDIVKIGETLHERIRKKTPIRRADWDSDSRCAASSVPGEMT